MHPSLWLGIAILIFPHSKTWTASLLTPQHPADYQDLVQQLPYSPTIKPSAYSDSIGCTTPSASHAPSRHLVQSDARTTAARGYLPDDRAYRAPNKTVIHMQMARSLPEQRSHVAHGSVARDAFVAALYPFLITVCTQPVPRMIGFGEGAANRYHNMSFSGSVCARQHFTWD